jgi:excisionase family DNA binding protein
VARRGKDQILVTTNQKTILTLDEAAAYLRVHRRTMTRLLRQGVVPGTKIGRQWRIRHTDLDALLATTSHASNRDDSAPAAVSPDEAGSRRAGHNGRPVRTVRVAPLVWGPLASLLGMGPVLLI